MRKTFDDIVEEGREKTGQYASCRGDRYGAFKVRCPITRRDLLIIAADGDGWQQMNLPGEPWEHVSVSTKDRCPLWEEMCWVKDLFWLPSECVIQYHPPKEKYVNNHRFVLHLWKPCGISLPMPPIQCV